MRTKAEPMPGIPATATSRYGPRSLAPCVSALSLWAILLLGAPGHCHGSSLWHLLSGKSFPLIVHLKDLNGQWRRFTVRENSASSGNVSVNVSGNARGSVAQNNLPGLVGGSRSYVTKGQTAWADGRRYLVAYRLPAFGLDLNVLLHALATKTPPTGMGLTPESALSLCLLDLRTVGSIEDVGAFDGKQEIRKSEEAAKALSALLKGGGTTEKKAEKKR
jgi:hypothetical protein